MELIIVKFLRSVLYVENPMDPPYGAEQLINVQFSMWPSGLVQSIAPPEYTFEEQFMNLEFVRVMLTVE